MTRKVCFAQMIKSEIIKLFRNNNKNYWHGIVWNRSSLCLSIEITSEIIRCRASLVTINGSFQQLKNRWMRRILFIDRGRISLRTLAWNNATVLLPNIISINHRMETWPQVQDQPWLQVRCHYVSLNARIDTLLFIMYTATKQSFSINHHNVVQLFSSYFILVTLTRLLLSGNRFLPGCPQIFSL